MFSSQGPGFLTLVQKLIILFLPFVTLICLELFVLPIHFFTFRGWEALRVRKLHNFLPGPFYPSMSLEMIGEGDLAYRTKEAKKKRLKWQTDRYGFRNLPTLKMDSLEAIIVGDSMTAGASMTQEDTLTHLLSYEKKVPTYSYASRSFLDFLKDPRFRNTPAKYLIYERIERFLAPIAPIHRQIAYDKPRPAYFEIMAPLFIFLDRASDPFFVRWIRSRIADGKWLIGNEAENVVGSNDFLFLRGAEGVIATNEEMLNVSLRGLLSYQLKAKQRGMTFIFFPAPNKSTVYYDRLNIKKPDYLSRLIKLAREHGIPVVDTPRLFWSYKDKYPAHLLYHSDDSHWSPLGCRLAADELYRVVTEQREKLFSGSPK